MVRRMSQSVRNRRLQRPVRRALPTIVACLLYATIASAGTTISISFDRSVRAHPASGRLVVYLISPDSKMPPDKEPAVGPFWSTPQPIYGIDVKNLASGEQVIIDDSASSFPTKLSELPPGKYRAQAVLRI